MDNQTPPLWYAVIDDHDHTANTGHEEPADAFAESVASGHHAIRSRRFTLADDAQAVSE